MKMLAVFWVPQVLGSYSNGNSESEHKFDNLSCGGYTSIRVCRKTLCGIGIGFENMGQSEDYFGWLGQATLCPSYKI